jgi:predicted Holliday junction resolvase-like endonuclease
MDVNEAIKTIDHAASMDDRWMFVALLVIGLVTVFVLARYFMRQIEALQREIVATRSEFEEHLKTANAEMVAALTKSSEIIAHNSVVMEQLKERLKR